VNALVGRTVRYEYATPAVSCQSSFRRKMEGKVTRIRHNPTPYFGRNTLVVVSDTGESNYVSDCEVTHVRRGGRWVKYRPNASRQRIGGKGDSNE